MKKPLTVFGLAAVIGLISTASFAFPLRQSNLLRAPSNVVEARVVCDETGVCVRSPTRRPTARWIYGDRSFYGPYDGPRYYGHPTGATAGGSSAFGEECSVSRFAVFYSLPQSRSRAQN